jgi:outer membrane protein insertion porin family
MKILQFIFSLLIVSLVADISSAQSELEKQYTILGITVEGNQSGSAETIISQSGLFRGQKITLPSDDLRRAMTRLWQQGIFADVSIDVEKISQQSDGTDGLFLVIRVKELSRLDTIIYEGNDELSRADIEKSVRFYKNDFVRPWEVADAARRIEELYAKEGYQYANVQTRTEPTTDGTNRVKLHFTVTEGTEITVRNIDFVGNAKITDGDLRGAMEETKEKKWWKIFSSGKFDAKKYEEDKKKVIAYYRTEGFRDAAILSDSLWVTNGEDLNILINVYEGNQYYLRHINIVGNEVFTEDEIRRNLGFRMGDLYNSEKFELNLKGPTPDFIDVGSLYYDRGYMVNIQKEETVVGSDSLDVTIRIAEGKRHYFRNIDVAGNTKTKDFVVRRELFVRPGEPFSRAAIIRSLRQLAQLNYFNQERLIPDVKPVPDATQFDVTFKVEERSSDTFNASIGYGGAQGLVGSLGVSFNNFDITDPLHGGAGQILSITAEFGSSSYRTLSLNFTEPWLFQEPTLLGFSVYNQSYNYLYSVNRTGAAISLGRRFRWPDDFFRGDWRLSGQNSDIKEGGGIYVPGKHDELSLQQTISRNSTDDPLFPATGSEFALQTRVAFLPVESIAPNEPSNYFLTNFSMKFFAPLAQLGVSQKLVLVTSFDVGQISGIGSTPYIPPTERFTMGGSGLSTGFTTIALRGYPDASIGRPRAGSANTFTEAGEAYMKYGAEIRFQISREPIPLFVLTFAEAGNVWRDFSHADPFNLKRAVGVGARVQVPAVGLLGIDLGYGFDSPENFGEKSGWQTHFQFGRAF